MPSYGATDVILVIILACLVLPWSQLAWKIIIYITRKLVRWTFAYGIAVTVVAFLQYSTWYNSLKTIGDFTMNDIIYSTLRNSVSRLVEWLFDNSKTTNTGEL